MKRSIASLANSAAVVLLTFGMINSLWALDPPDRSRGVGQKAFRHPDFEISNAFERPSQLPPQAAAALQQQLAGLGLSDEQARLDRRGGRWASLLFSHPLIPGTGVGNSLNWHPAPPANDQAYQQAAADAFNGFLQARAALLGIDLNELARPGKVTVQRGGELVQIYIPRQIDGILVRGSYLSATINHGNLILFGVQNWGTINVSRRPVLSQNDAMASLQAYLDTFTPSSSWGRAELNIVPMAQGQNISQVAVGQGYAHRLAWVLKVSFAGDQGRWEALVDAQNGEVLSFQDTNHYAEIKGGVYPVSNDGINPTGVEQAGWPMSFADITTSSGTQTTDTGGNVAATGSMTSNLLGPFIRMNDNCGAISLSQSDSIDFSTSGGTDCATPGFGGAGNTHASRTGFYELNKIKEMARSHLPSNTWLQQRLTANMNINNTCNAYWDTLLGTVNFYRSGGGCANTGEIAGVFDHEWGHGMDSNDAAPGIASPSGEGIADIYAALRLNDSCIGRNFKPGVQCDGFGDACLSCTGVRDIDYLKRQSGQPHDYTWANQKCHGSVHCLGGVYAEAVWSLWKRELPNFYGMDDNTAHEIVNRLTFIGAGATGTWFSGGPPYGGCAAGSGYLNYLAADDDNGNLLDGTPHMQAIFKAFNDQQIACQTPTVQSSGCAGAPTTAPAVSASRFDKSVGLTWNSVAYAASYEVFRTEGVSACGFGKVKLGETIGTSWNDSGLQNGRGYSYVVIPKGSNAACFGPASSCITENPAAGPNLDIDPSSAVLVISNDEYNDGDSFIDNGESATMTFEVRNTGLGPLSNVHIVSVTPSNGGIAVSTNPAPAVTPSNLNEGTTGIGSFSFTAAANALAFGETLVFEISVTSDELTPEGLPPVVKTQTLTIANTQSDVQCVPSKTWNFNNDLDGWTWSQGTFNQANGYVASSAFLDNQCDKIRSPAIRLTPISTMSVSTNFDIEPFSQNTWWDRANVGVIDSSNVRTALNPDGGRLYTAYTSPGFEGLYTGCNDPEQGWAGLGDNWALSTWSPTALQTGTLAGRDVRLEVTYATDGAVANRGFSFDQVTLTNFQMLVPDGQGSGCSCTSDAHCNDGMFCNGAETCNAGSCQAATDPCPNQACDEMNDVCVPFVCNNNGTCEPGENCSNCPNDCVSGSTPGASCGNGICEAGDGENAVNCSVDCNGLLSGKPSNRFSCGFNDGYLPDGCGDSRCSSGGYQCTTVPVTAVNYCCGDNVCEGAENSSTCSLDCGAAPFCGDGSCNGNETQCSCALDCGTPPSSEAGLCTDGIDNDCSGDTDCADAACSSDPACQQVNCSQIGNKSACNAEASCRWDNRNNKCIPK